MTRLPDKLCTESSRPSIASFRFNISVWKSPLILHCDSDGDVLHLGSIGFNSGRSIIDNLIYPSTLAGIVILIDIEDAIFCQGLTGAVVSHQSRDS